MEGLLCARFDVCISNFCDNKTKALISSHFTAGQTEVRIGSWIGAAHTADKQRCWIQTRPGLQISQPFLCIIPRGLVIVQNDNMLTKLRSLKCHLMHLWGRGSGGIAWCWGLLPMKVLYSRCVSGSNRSSEMLENTARNQTKSSSQYATDRQPREALGAGN